MADYPLEFYRRSEQQWHRRTIRPLAPIAAACSTDEGEAQKVEGLRCIEIEVNIGPPSG